MDLLKTKFGVDADTAVLKGNSQDKIKEDLYNLIVSSYEEKEKIAGPEIMRYLERTVFLQIIDSKWKDHLYAMDKLREGIGLRAYGHRDPLIEYKNEAFSGFSEMISAIEEEALDVIFKLQPAKPERFKRVFSPGQTELLHPQVQRPSSAKSDFAAGESGPVKTQPAVAQVKPSMPKVGRNDPCPCGSGKKYKKCCGR